MWVHWGHLMKGEKCITTDLFPAVSRGGRFTVLWGSPEGTKTNLVTLFNRIQDEARFGGLRGHSYGQPIIIQGEGPVVHLRCSRRGHVEAG
jgi:hypothetical protein